MGVEKEGIYNKVCLRHITCPISTELLTLTPKSGEVELHTAPMLAVAIMASTARAELGR